MIAFFPVSWYFSHVWDGIMIFTFSMISPALIMYVIYYIRKSTFRYESSRILGKYHLHEGFVGIILIIVSISLLILRSQLLFLTNPLWRRLSFIFVLVQIFSILFIYVGSFFLFRDWDDITSLKFIEIKETKTNRDITGDYKVFSEISQDDLHFFTIPCILLYPFGILLTIVSINLIIYGSNFILIHAIELEEELYIYAGYFSCFIAGGLIGIDWLRIFKIIYPEIYDELDAIIKELKDSQ
ncbi:MAG: hypothetical protein EU539_00920 [Promethearchaeota archaeon]|nr:MAG: hypothetical protein EU539_00920 [Candidatus Lokiarchaeota archaeon]